MAGGSGKKPRSRIVFGGAIAVALLAAGGGIVAWKLMVRQAAWLVAPDGMPDGVDEVTERPADLAEAREPDPHKQELLFHAHLGAELRGATLESLLQKPELAAALECGKRVARAMGSPNVATVRFVDGKKTHVVKVIRVGLDELPAACGTCAVTDAACGADSPAAARDDGHWLFGTKEGVESAARARKDRRGASDPVAARLRAVQDGAAGYKRLFFRQSSEHMKAVDALNMPCRPWDAGSGPRALSACLPEHAEPLLGRIDAALRAVGLGREPYDRGAARGRLLLVADDDAAAMAMERDVQEYVGLWKERIDRERDALTAAAKKRGERDGALAAAYLRALARMKTSRVGRLVALDFAEDLTDAERKALAEADAQPQARRDAMAAVLDAVSNNQPPPAASLAKLIDRGDTSSDPTAAPKDVMTEPFADEFERANLGSNWTVLMTPEAAKELPPGTPPDWRIENGKLCGGARRGHSVRLDRVLPVNARFQFDTTTDDARGEVRAIWGNPGYHFVFSSKSDGFHVLARNDENAPDC